MPVVLVGAAKLQIRLQHLATELPTIVKLALSAGGLVIQNDAKVRAPYDTGNLRRSIHLEVTGDGAIAYLMVGTDVEYAVYQEFGTSKMDAHPFLRPAFDENQAEVIAVIVEAIRKLIEVAVTL